MKHIRMPKASWEKWETALRSGEYKRGVRALHTSFGGFCCLGVLQHCLTGKVEEDPFGGVTLGAPTYSWLKKHNIAFFSSYGSTARAPFIEARASAVTGINDATDRANQPIYSFNEIADLLATEVEFTDQ